MCEQIRMNDVLDVPRKLTRDVALEIVRDAIQPGEPTLGMWLGWNQPMDDESSVTLGSATAVPHPFTLREVLEGSDIGFEAARDLVKLALERSPSPLDYNVSSNTLLMCDEVFVPFGELEEEDKCLFHLKVMVVNTMTEGHNWCIEWGEYLAQYHAKYTCGRDDLEFYVYDSHWDEGIDSDIVSGCLDVGLEIPYHIHDGDYYCSLKPSQETVEWLQEEQEPYGYDRAELLFGETQFYSGSDVYTVLGWIVEWLQEEQKAGNLTIDWDRHDARDSDK